MTITSTVNKPASVVNFVTGSHLDTGSGPADASITLGFEPKYVRVANETDGKPIIEWFEGMTSDHALQATNNSTTQFSTLTSSGIKVPGDGTFSFAVTQNKQYRYVAFG